MTWFTNVLMEITSLCTEIIGGSGPFPLPPPPLPSYTIVNDDFA